MRATESLSQGESSAKETGRIEAFSDGVFAIAMTLLVLDLKVPKEVGANHSLSSALLEQWPSYLAFLISFATVGIMWMNHHRLFTLIHRTDHWLLVLNGLLLFGSYCGSLSDGAVGSVPRQLGATHGGAGLQRVICGHRGPVQRAMALREP